MHLLASTCKLKRPSNYIQANEQTNSIEEKRCREFNMQYYYFLLRKQTPLPVLFYLNLEFLFKNKNEYLIVQNTSKFEICIKLTVFLFFVVYFVRFDMFFDTKKNKINFKFKRNIKIKKKKNVRTLLSHQLPAEFLSQRLAGKIVCFFCFSGCATARNRHLAAHAFSLCT